MGTALGFEVSKVETLQKNEGDEQGQNKIQDSGGLMLKTVIEGPVGRQGMKQIVLNLPPAVSDFPKKTSRESIGR